MTTPVVLRKLNNRVTNTWAYKTYEDAGTITLKHCDLDEQFQALTDIFVRAYEKPLIISTTLHAPVLDMMEALNPNVRYACIENETRRFVFPHVWNVDVDHQRKNAGKVTHVCSDASTKSSIRSSSWSFVSTNKEVGYDYGQLSEFMGSTQTEFYALYAAIVAHKNSSNRVVFYTDSKIATELVSGDDMTSFMNDSHISQMREEMREILNSRKTDRVQWVRGHKRQRLNIIADALAYMASNWKRSESSRINHMDAYYALSTFI